MKCPNCGQIIPEEAHICPFCLFNIQAWQEGKITPGSDNQSSQINNTEVTHLSSDQGHSSRSINNEPIQNDPVTYGQSDNVTPNVGYADNFTSVNNSQPESRSISNPSYDQNPAPANDRPAPKPINPGETISFENPGELDQFAQQVASWARRPDPTQQAPQNNYYSNNYQESGVQSGYQTSAADDYQMDDEPTIQFDPQEFRENDAQQQLNGQYSDPYYNSQPSNMTQNNNYSAPNTMANNNLPPQEPTLDQNIPKKSKGSNNKSRMIGIIVAIVAVIGLLLTSFFLFRYLTHSSIGGQEVNSLTFKDAQIKVFNKQVKKTPIGDPKKIAISFFIKDLKEIPSSNILIKDDDDQLINFNPDQKKVNLTDGQGTLTGTIQNLKFASNNLTVQILNDKKKNYIKAL